MRAARVDAPLSPNPLLNGRFEVISTSSGVSARSRNALDTVGKSMGFPLKVTCVDSACACANSTVTPSLTVKPHPKECIFAGLSWAMILNSPDIFPGANALAISRVKSCPAIVLEFEENVERFVPWLVRC